MIQKLKKIIINITAVVAIAAPMLAVPATVYADPPAIDAATGAVTACSQRRATLTAPEYNELIGLDDPLEPPLRLGGTTGNVIPDGSRVTINGKTVTELGTKVDPQSQKVAVDGEVLRRC